MLGISEKQRLLNHPHIGPVIFELVAAVQANYVMLAGGRGDIPA
jgi:hypothetical protein